MLATIMSSNVFFVINPGAAKDGRCNGSGRGTQPRSREARQAALGAPHLFHTASRFRHAVESLRDDVHHPRFSQS
jgi:uncharacterized membrane protein